MGYSTSFQVQNVLASILQRGTTTTGAPVEIINIGREVRDTVLPDDFVQFIRWADDHIDAAIGVVYRAPLKRIVKGEYELLADITAGDTSLQIEDATRFYPGDIVTITDRIVVEKKIIDTIPDEITINVTSAITNGFLVSDSVVQRLGYPDPISLISARYAASNLYDKYFAAQSSPAVSEYGGNLRNMAESDLNNVINGRIRLFGQRLLGRRFFNPTTLDVPHIGAPNKDRDNKNA